VVIATLPTAAFGFVGGAIADALGPRRAMVSCDMARTLLIAVVPLLLRQAPRLSLYMHASCWRECSAPSSTQRGSRSFPACSTGTVGRGERADRATDRTVEILGALAAGFLVAWFGAGAFYIDALTFAVSALLILRIRIAPPPPAGVSIASILRDTGVGLAVLVDSAVLRANTVFSLAAQLALPVVNGLTPTLLIRRFANGNADLGATLFGRRRRRMPRAPSSRG
jgi:hypothetical protein